MTSLLRSPKARTVYHITHLDNLEEIFRCGVLLPASQAIPVTNFADTEIKKKRQDFKLGVEPYGYLADYTPFHFVPTTPYFHRITNSPRSAAQPVRQAHFVVIRLDFEPQSHAQINSSPSIVTSAHPLSSRVEIAKASPENIENMVDWRVIHSKTPWDVKDLFEEEWRLRRQAELLVFGGLKIEGANLKLFVRTDPALKKLDDILKASDSDCEAAIGEKYFNHHFA